jgi:hypothetical protein
MKSDGDSELFKIACRILKIFSFVLLGFAIACVLSGVLGALSFAVSLLITLGPWLIRAAIVIGCIISVAIIVESMRH